MIRFEHVTKQYGDNVILNDLNFEIEEGKFVILIGPSGCGKTTTLKMINRLIEPDKGNIFINGKDTAGGKPGRIETLHRLCDSADRPFPEYDGCPKYYGCPPAAQV